jgi:hypothetical protein
MDLPLPCLLTDTLFRKAKQLLHLYLQVNALMHDSVTIWFPIYLQVVARFNEIVTNLLLQGPGVIFCENRKYNCIIKHNKD